MTAREAYISFLNLANKLNSNDDINIDIARFVLLYNKWAKVWLVSKIRNDRATQKIDESQQLINERVILTPIAVTPEYVNYALPNDWYDYVSGYAICSRGPCIGKIINADQVKNEEKRLILFDENWRPDFDFEWLPITIGENKIQVYFREFEVNSFYIDYYREPKNIDIAGYQKVDGTQSSDIDPDIYDIYVNEIIDLVVADVSRIYQNNEKVQLDLNRIKQ